MNAEILTSQVITEGGCNACLPYELNTFTLQLPDGRSFSLENLDAAALVMPIAQINQWQTRLLLEEDEGLIYQKGTQEVIFVEGSRQDTVSSKGQTSADRIVWHRTDFLRSAGCTSIRGRKKAACACTDLLKLAF